MAAKKSEQRLHWEAYLRIKHRLQQRSQKFIYRRDNLSRRAIFGSYVQVAPATPEAIEEANRDLMKRYNHTKSFLRSLNIELSPPELNVKDPNLLSSGHYCTSVAWRAVASKPLTNEVKRKIALRQKRMRRAALCQI